MREKDVPDIAVLLQKKEPDLTYAEATARAHELLELYKMLIRRPPDG